MDGKSWLMSKMLLHEAACPRQLTWEIKHLQFPRQHLNSPTVAPSSIDDTPTEPATSPRMIDPQMREWLIELQLPTREIGPRPEPEVYPTRFTCQ